MTRPGFSFSVFLLTALFSAGCGDHAENKGTDNAFIRAPGEETKPLKMADGALLPLNVQNKWMYKTTNRVINPRASSAVPDANQTFADQMTVTNLKRTGATMTATLETRRGNQLHQKETFRTGSDTIALVSVGGASWQEPFEFSPPVPVVTFPIIEGNITTWNGIIQSSNASVPGTAYTRVSGRNLVKTPAGELVAYRVQTIVSTLIDGRQAGFLTIRWFAPGVGLVRQQSFVGASVTEKILTSYDVPER